MESCGCTSPPLAVSCCLSASSSCSLTRSCWLFLSRSVSKEIILCNDQHHTHTHTHLHICTYTYILKNSKKPDNPTWYSSTLLTKQTFLHLQQLAFIGVGWFDMPFGQFINLSPEVRVLLPESLQLHLGHLGGRAAGFEAQPGDDGLFSTFRRHGDFVWCSGSYLDW